MFGSPPTTELGPGLDESLLRPGADPWRSGESPEDSMDAGLSGFWQEGRSLWSDAYGQDTRRPSSDPHSSPIRCPLCGALVEPSGRAMRVFAVVVGVFVVAAVSAAKALHVSGLHAALFGALLPILGVLQWLLPLLARVARARDVPDECPQCHGPLRTALQAEWGSKAWYESPYMRVRWQPDED